MNFDDRFFNRVEKKTKINKDTIISLATKLQQGNLKDHDSLKEVIDTLSKMTGKNISDTKKEKIIETIQKGHVPKNVDKMF